MIIDDTVRGLANDLGHRDVPDAVVADVVRELAYDHLDGLCDSREDVNGRDKANS